MELESAEGHAERPLVRETTALEVFNVPLFEAPPMLDVRAGADFGRSHVTCAVSVPAEDGPDEARLFQRILDHDDVWGWVLQFPLVVVYDEATRGRADWLVAVLRGAIRARAGLQGFDGAGRAESLLRRLAFQCRQILLLRHSDFAASFGCCCAEGAAWAAAGFSERLGPLPRCALLRPRLFLAGRQVQLGPELLATLGVTHVVVNGDCWDAMDGTSGGGSGCPLLERPEDVPGVRYLKCNVSENGDDAELPRVLEGAARFLAACDAKGGVGLVRMHGLSTSVSVVCAFLVCARGLSVQAAWDVFAEARIKVDERPVWWEALRRLSPHARALQDLPAHG